MLSAVTYVFGNVNDTHLQELYRKSAIKRLCVKLFEIGWVDGIYLLNDAPQYWGFRPRQGPKLT